MIGQNAVFGPALFSEGIAGLGRRSRVAHQQITGCRASQPSVEKSGIPPLATGQAIDAQEAGVHRVSGAPRQFPQ